MIGTKILEERKSKYNGDLRVVKTWGMGTYIQSNGLTQSGGIVESIWKQTLRNIQNSRFLIPRILVLGMGGGTLVKLIKKKWPKAKITGVDIDPVMVELGEKYLGLDKNLVDIHISDAFSYSQQLSANSKQSLAKSEFGKQFDLVIVDLYNGDTFPKKFESEQFSSLVHGYMKKNGIVIFNRLYYGDKRPDAVRFGLKLQKIFKKVEYYYPEANLMFICSN